MNRIFRIVIPAAAFMLLTAGISHAVDFKGCKECHGKVGELFGSGKHSAVGCDKCHSNLDLHLKDQKPENRPTTDLSWQACGACHKPQMDSFLKTSYHKPGRDEKSQLTGRAPNPAWDKLMMGNGFTKEHATTRSHAWMLADQYLVDRAYGGRFQPKNGWEYLAEDAGKGVWSYVTDTKPEEKENKIFLPQTAKAANSVCLQCKTQDNILGWAYTGAPDAKGATWSRTSNVIDLVKASSYGLNCFTCHDPHSAKPRIVRDALIEALTRPEGDTVWHKDEKRTKFKVIDLGERGFTRKIAILEKADDRLLCAQCHVEYLCGTAVNPVTGEAIGMKDPITNHMPMKDALGLYDHYQNQVKAMDWKHPLTGALLQKSQHPEAETYYASVHSKNGVGCGDCHTPRVKDEKTGASYTSHFAVSSKVQLKDTCLKCHDYWDEEKAGYVIDSVKAYTKGKMRKAEFWLETLIDKIVEAQKAGVAEETLAKAREQHSRAHTLWEYWTAENSDGFHNPPLARESLTRSMDESQKGIKLLDEAMAKK
jgi:formate-dependent nitrite reductase cytochrome c552 subunit